MKKNLLLAFSVWCLTLTATICQAREVTVKSPSGNLEVVISDNAGKPTYRLSLDGKPMLTESALGLRTTMGDFTQGLAITDSKTETIEKQYDILNIKTSHINYKANSLTLALENQKKHK